MTLKDEIRKLSSVHRQELMQAFEQGIDRYVIVREDIFVGVHLVPDAKLHVIEAEGAWSYGRLKTPDS